MRHCWENSTFRKLFNWFKILSKLCIFLFVMIAISVTCLVSIYTPNEYTYNVPLYNYNVTSINSRTYLLTKCKRKISCTVNRHENSSWWLNFQQWYIYIMAVKFIGGRNRSRRIRNQPLIYSNSLKNRKVISRSRQKSQL